MNVRQVCYGGPLCRTMYFETEPKFEQFTVDARSPPQPVLLTHFLNERAQLATNFGTSWLTTRLPTPVRSKSCSVPAQNRVRPNHARQGEQIGPESCHPHQQRSINSMQPKATRCTSQRDVELMPQIQVLDVKPAS